MSQAAPNVWADFAELRDWIKVVPNVNQLKFIIEGLNTEVRQTRVISKYGKKQQLVDRLVAELEDWHVKRNAEAWIRARAVVIEVRTTKQYEPKRGPPAPLSVMQPHPIHPAPAATPNYATKPYPYAAASSAGSLSYGAYPNPNTARIGQSSSAVVPQRQQDIRFASSPFLRVDQLVSKVVECLESVSAMDRRSQVVNFTLTPDQAMKLLGSPSKYQLRLFCTSSSYYSPNRPSNTPCQIEFPPTCEVRVNETLLNANLKGLKKKPGTAPPANLGSQARLSAGSSTKVEMVYVNSQQPVHKKYYLAVQLVETFSVESIVERIRKGKFRSREEVLATMKQSSAPLDDEIEAGPQKMSLKCPLSYIRIQVPARSIKCVHPQCFDATSWFSMMEQTTTWLCPVCEKTLNVEELIVDGYFDDILKSTHEDVEDVMVETDGEWHTQDNKYASAAWKSKLPPPAVAKAPVVPASNPASSSPAASFAAPSPVLPRASVSYEVYEIFDSDDEVDASTPSIPSFPPSIRHTSTSVASSSARRPSTTEVIDLTLSDSEEDDAPARPAPPAPIAPVIRRADKRKERDSPSSAHHDNDSAKRARTDSFPPPPPPTGYATGASSASSASSSSTFRPALDYPFGPTYGANTVFNYAGLAVTPGAAAGPLYNRPAQTASRRSSTSSAAELDRFHNPY